MSEHMLILDGFAGDIAAQPLRVVSIAGKIVLLDDPAEAIIHAMRDGATFRLSLLASSVDDTVRFVLAAEPARQADGRDAEIARLTAEVERHRMTTHTRDATEKAVMALDGTWMQPVLRDFLDRTAPKEAGRE